MLTEEVPAMAANPVVAPELKLVAERKATMDNKIAELRYKRTKIELGGGNQRIEKASRDRPAHRARARGKARRPGKFPGNRRFGETSLHLLWHGGQRTVGGWSGHRICDG